MFTRREPGIALPIELGAEFIHGRTPATLGWLAKSNTAIVDVGRRALDAVRRQTRALRQSVRADETRLAAASSDRARTCLSANSSTPSRVANCRRPRASSHAHWSKASTPPTRRVSARGRRSMNGVATAPPTHRRFVRSAATLRWSTAWPARSTRTRFEYDSTRSCTPFIGNAASVTIEASRHGQPCSVQAKRAIITLPLGVLQLPAHAAGAVRFVPDARKQQALAGLAPGPVIKVVLHFRKPFWEEIDDGRYRDGVFFRVPGAPFPTFWSTVPLRGSLLNAWAGGPECEESRPAATKLSWPASGARQSAVDVRQEGQSSQHARTRVPARLAGRSVRARRIQLRRRRRHGERARRSQRRCRTRCSSQAKLPTREGESGTVAGALQSGMRAARQILAE